MKRLLTYGLLLLTILASHFVVSACQDDLSDTTEVMMTFTTRAVMGEASTAPDNERMKDLRVIMLRENGTVVDNHFEEGINASSVTFTFTTPIQTGGEDFTFLAVANEESIQSESESELSWLSCSPGDNLSSTLSAIKAQKIGDGTAFDINDGSIPQTKQWTVTVPQASTHVENQQLDFVASKISVQFINNTNAEQSLSNIRITGIGHNVYGYLFAQNSIDFVGTQHDASDITFSDVTVSAGATSDAQTYYTYPVGSISSPTLYARWNGSEYDLPIEINDEFITALNRNDHLKIIVTLTGQELVVNYIIAPWNTDNTTNIGSPTTNGGYQVDGWGNGNDIIIGGEIGGGDEPGGEEPGGGEEPDPDVPVGPGGVIWYKTLDASIDLSYGVAPQSIKLTSEDLSNFVAGRVLGIAFTGSANGQMCVQRINSGDGYDSDKRNLPSQPGRINVSGDQTYYEFPLTNDDVSAIKDEGGGLGFWGNGVSITQIYIKAPIN